MKKYFLLLICLIAIMLAQTGFAAPVGRITATEGRIDVLKSGQNTAAPISVGNAVDLGDIYRARSGSRAEILFTNGNTMRIAPNTRVEINEYTDEGDKQTAVMKLQRGRVQVIAGKDFVKKAAAFAEGNSKFEVHTPNAVAGIRGSNMISFHEKGWSGALFLAGYGYFCNPSNVCVPLNMGYMSFIKGAADTPVNPFLVPAGVMGAMEAGFLQAMRNAGDVENLINGIPGMTQTTGGNADMAYYTGEPQGITDIFVPPPVTPPFGTGTTETTYKGVLFGNFLTDDFDWGGELNPDGTEAGRINNLAGAIIDGFNAGSADIGSAPYTTAVHPIWAGTIEGTSGTGGAFYGDAAGSWTSWDGNFVSVYVQGNNAGFLTGALAGTSTEPVENMGNFTGSGQIAKNFVGTTDLTPFEGDTQLDKLRNALDGSLVQSNFFDIREWTIGGGDNAITFGPARNHTDTMTLVLNDNNTTIGTLRHLLSGHNYRNENSATNITGYMGVTNRIDQVYLLGPARVTDNLAGKLHMDAAYSYIDTRRLGTVNASYEGTYNNINDNNDYRLAGVGALTAKNLAFVSPVSGGAGSAIYNIPTTGNGRWWNLAIIETGAGGGSTLYISNTISDNGIPGGDPSTWTRIGSLSTPVYFRLTWGETPRDLDSHIYGPNGIHVYYANRGSLIEYPYIYLDQDVTSGWGPELITVNMLEVGNTYYSVFNWSGEAPITASNAVVELMTSGFSALFGGTDSLWNAGLNPVPVTMIGQYFLPPTGAAQTWSSRIYSYDYNNGTYTTYDGGAYEGFVGGYTIGDAMGGNVIAIGVDPNENGMIIKGALAGNFFAGINMFGMTGSLYTIPVGEEGVVCPPDFHGSVLTTTTAGANGTGTFTGGGTMQNITSSLIEKHVVVNNMFQPWGVWEVLSNGEYTGTTSNTWTGSLDFDSANNGISNINHVDVVGSQWSGNKLAGKAYGYGADGATGTTWISSGETVGVFNPVSNIAGTLQAISMGPWFETTKFLEMAADATANGGQARLQRLDIPAVQVGSVNLSCTGCSNQTPVNGFTSLNMNDVKFFATNTGEAPKIWASGNGPNSGVSGTYVGVPSTAPNNNNVNLSGGGLNARFNLQQWNTTNNNWTAKVAGSGTLPGSNYGGITFKGAAAGSINPGVGGGSITGTAAGTAKKQ